MRLLVDTSILVRTLSAADPLHNTCLRALDVLQADGHEPCICAQVMIEYWVVATRPEDVNGLGLTPQRAGRALRDWRDALTWLPEPPDAAQRWFSLVTEHSVSGRPAHDARLVAVMQAHGITRLLTLNPGDFKRYEGVECIDPADVVRSADEADN